MYISFQEIIKFNKMVKHKIKELMQKAKNGDIQAFEEIITIHLTDLRNFALSMTGGDRVLSDDILQEALIKIFMNLDKFRGEASFTSWLWRIVRNEFLNYKRSKKFKQFDPIDEAKIESREAKNIDENMVEKEKHSLLLKLVEMLPEHLCEAITLIDLQELTYDAAAEIVGISLGAMKSRVYTARRKLTELALEHENFFRN